MHRAFEHAHADGCGGTGGLQVASSLHVASAGNVPSLDCTHMLVVRFAQLHLRGWHSRDFSHDAWVTNVPFADAAHVCVTWSTHVHAAAAQLVSPSHAVWFANMPSADIVQREWSLSEHPHLI